MMIKLKTNYFLNKQWLHKRFLNKEISKAIKNHGRGLALDIGCGEKPYRHLFAHANCRYYGLDLPSTLHNTSLIDIYASGKELPIKTSSIDVVFSSQTIEHINEPEKMFSEMSRVLKSGGKLILTAPHIWCIHEAPHDYFRFTRYGLEFLSKKYKIEPIYIKAMGGFWVTTGVRLSNYIFPEKTNNKLIRSVFGFICFVIQGLSLILDKLHHKEDETHNYIMVGIKR